MNSTEVKAGINWLLSQFNLRLETLTNHRKELSRLTKLEASGHFERPVYPLLPGFDLCASNERIFEMIEAYRAELERLTHGELNQVGYTYENDWFSSPDAEVLYVMIRSARPSLIVEVGSGNSTRVQRQAILDGQLSTRIVAIDPSPRRDVAALVDEFLKVPAEELADSLLWRDLGPNDILFVDSSHLTKSANDVVFLFTKIIPYLRAGVLVHVHDIFLPYEYPLQWIKDHDSALAEQYLVQTLLSQPSRFEVVWAGYYLQRRLPHLFEKLPHCRGGDARSLWLRAT